MNKLNLSFLILLIISTSCSDQKITPQESWVLLGRDFANCVVHDPVDRGKAQNLVVQAFLENNQPDRAIETAEQISDWMRALAHIKIAAYYQENQEEASCTEWMNKAASFMHEFAGEKKSNIAVEYLSTAARIGRQDLIPNVANIPMDQSDNNFSAKLTLSEDLWKRGLHQKSLEILLELHGQTVRLLPRKKRIFVRYLELIHSSKVKEESDLKTLVNNAFNEYKSLLSIQDQIDLQGEHVWWLIENNQPDEARSLLEDLEDELIDTHYSPFGAVIYQLAMAARWNRLGEVEKAIHYLEKTEECIDAPKIAPPQAIHYARTQLALEWLRCNQTHKFDERMDQVILLMNEVGGLRTKSMKAAQLCLDLAPVHESLTERPRFEEQIRNLLSQLQIEAQKRDFIESR